MVLIISWWVQPTVIWPYKACSLSWAASNVWYMLKFLLPGSSKTFLNSVMSCSSSSFERMYCGCSWKKVSACSLVCLYFSQKMLELIALFFDAELSALWFDNDLFFARSDGTYGRDWHSSILFALASCSFWAPGCCTGLLTEEGRGTWAQPISKRQEYSYKIFSY